jgi:hypothetical protein
MPAKSGPSCNARSRASYVSIGNEARGPAKSVHFVRTLVRSRRPMRRACPLSANSGHRRSIGSTSQARSCIAATKRKLRGKAGASNIERGSQTVRTCSWRRSSQAKTGPKNQGRSYAARDRCLACQSAGETQKFVPARSSFGESRLCLFSLLELLSSPTAVRRATSASRACATRDDVDDVRFGS